MRVSFFAVLAVLLLAWECAPALAQQAESEARQIEVPSLRIGNETYEPQGKVRLGPLRVSPFVYERFGYDSNIYLVENRVIDDFPLVTEAGARLLLAQSKQLFLVDYRIRLNEYTKHGGGDNTEHEADMLANFRFDSFFVKLKERYANLFEPTPVYFDTKARREENKAGLSAGFDLGKLYVEVGCTLRSYHFEGDTYDRASNRQSSISSELGYKLTSKTQARLRFDTGSVNYNYGIQNDYTYTSLFLGVHHHVSGKLSSYLYLGSTSQSVDVQSNPQKKEFNGISASGSVAYQLSQRTSLSAMLLRELQYNAYVNYMVVTRFKATASHQWTKKVKVSARLVFEDSQPSEKLGLAAPSTRTIAGLSARYDLNSWMTAGLDFECTRKSTSLDNLSYSNNTVFAYLTLHF